MLEERTVGTAANDHNTDASLTRFIYSNHLQSASLELDEGAAVISYEEYHPYGTTAYQANNSDINAVAKRYRYTGKERDEESGLYYHGARYYVPWLCRWTAVDPLESKYAGMSSYNYSFNNPVMFNDPSGADPDDLKVSGQQMQLNLPQATGGFSNVPTVDALRVERPIIVDGGFNSGKGSSENPIALDDIVVNNMSFSMPSASRAPEGSRLARIKEYNAWYQKEMSDRAALDPYAFTLAQSPGIQAGLALAMPGYGEAMSGLQIYSGIQSENNTQIVLGSAGLLLSVYSSYNFFKNGGYAGSVTAASESKFVPMTETSVGRVATTEGTAVNVGVGTKISLSVENAAKVNPMYNQLEDAVGGTIIDIENSPYLTVQKGDKTFHISPGRVKEYVKNIRNPNSKWGDQVDFRKYGVPNGSEIIKGAGKGHKRTPTSGELKMFNDYFNNK